jgi:hypothetical protein
MRRRRKARALGRNVPMSSRQALTQAVMAADRGDCSRAQDLVRTARANAEEGDERILKDRFDEVSSLVKTCRAPLAGTAWKWRRHKNRR